MELYIRSPILWTGQQTKDYYYCPSSEENDPLIAKTHAANYFKDITITVLSVIRFFYFIYVLIMVYKSSSEKSFFSRPFFMNWLPILNLLTSFTALFAGSYYLYWTVQGHGKVICQLGDLDFFYTVIPFYMSGVSHYMFTAEFFNTSFALKKTISTLKILTADFVSRKDSQQAKIH